MAQIEGLKKMKGVGPSGGGDDGDSEELKEKMAEQERAMQEMKLNFERE